RIVTTIVHSGSFKPPIASSFEPRPRRRLPVLSICPARVLWKDSTVLFLLFFSK
ncbi:hypothetical protein KIL84_010540, partial [Mauremys mutica]